MLDPMSRVRGKKSIEPDLNSPHCQQTDGRGWVNALGNVLVQPTDFVKVM